MKMNLRNLGPGEAGQYRKIRLESLKAHPESFGSNYEEQSKLPKLMFEKAIEQPLDERFVIGAFDEGELIGICGFVPFAFDPFKGLENAGTLIQMYVRPGYRGKKLGQNLVSALVVEAFKNPQIEQIILGVREENLSAIRVYEQAGFRTYLPEALEEEGNQPSFRRMILRRESYDE